MLKQHFILRNFQIEDTRLPDSMAGLDCDFILILNLLIETSRYNFTIPFRPFDCAQYRQTPCDRKITRSDMRFRFRYFHNLRFYL